MLSTTILVAVFLALIFFSFATWGVLLWVGLRWARIEVTSLWRLAAATALSFGLILVLRIVFHLPTPTTTLQVWVAAIVDLAISVVVPCTVVCVLFRAKPLRAVQAWLPTLVSNGLAILLALAIRSYVSEAFKIPTNSMAPTVLGKHWTSDCPECGNPVYCTPHPEMRTDLPQSVEATMICDDFHVHEQTVMSDAAVGGGDRILCSKFLAPQRWDIVVFQYPENPQTFFIKRLVGLPGETIIIKGGSVWVNGKRLTPPGSLTGLTYETGIPTEYEQPFWGSPTKPALLGDDEYFVLGDFSQAARDSRFWEKGAPGHPPYAVPASYMQGVVTHTYWPPSRFRVHR